MRLTDQDILVEIRGAGEIFLAHAEALRQAPGIALAVAAYKAQIEATHALYAELGVYSLCGGCAGDGNESCCFSGVERFFDLVNLARVNLALGVALPTERDQEDGCFFNGPAGCRLLAKQSICLNHFCPSAKQALGPVRVKRLGLQGGAELWSGVELENALAAWLRRQTPTAA